MAAEDRGLIAADVAYQTTCAAPVIGTDRNSTGLRNVDHEDQAVDEERHKRERDPWIQTEMKSISDH